MLGGISIWQLLIILLILIMLFGTKRLKGLGSDLGDAIKGFRKSMNTDEEKTGLEDQSNASRPTTVDAEHRKVEDNARKD